jgi:glycosyltransferase involved in cell wall biosynthesis
MKSLKISLLIVARDAAGALPALLDDVIKQDFDLQMLQIVFVDGCSTDGTAGAFQRFRDAHPRLSVRVLTNQKRYLGAGWNAGLAASTGDIVIRVDAHARLPIDFLRRNAECISRGHDVCGGYRESVCAPGFQGKLAFLAERSRFGASAAQYRNRAAAGVVDTVAHGAYRRRVFETVGGFDERLLRTEDNEFHFRVRRAGFEIYYDPAIHSFHHARRTPGGLLRQKFLNGLWVGLGLGIEPRAFAWRHIAPFIFALGVLASLACLVTHAARSCGASCLAVILTCYASCAAAHSFSAVRSERGPQWPFLVCLPPVFFLMHLAYGLGTLIGIGRLPQFLCGTKGYKTVWPLGLPPAGNRSPITRQ